MIEQSNLGQLISLIENSRSPLSIGELACKLDVSTDRAHAMIQFWVKKGRIRKTTIPSECKSCSKNGKCVFIIDMPSSYEFVSQGEFIQSRGSSPCCISSCGCS